MDICYRKFVKEIYSYLDQNICEEFILSHENLLRYENPLTKNWENLVRRKNF